jgi:predicted outer membrane repeat protein
MQDSAVSNHTGEGIRVQVGPATLVSSTVSGNMTTWRAGGIWAANAPLTLINSTVTGNQAGVQGGGIMASGEATPGVSVTLSNKQHRGRQ